MLSRIVTISPQGQITIPKKIRRNLFSRKFVLEFHDEILLLKPCRVMVKKKNSFTSQVFLEKILELPEDQKTIYNIIRSEPCSGDMLIEKTGFEIQKINVLLTELEFKDLIRKNKNSLFEACRLE